MHALSMDIFDKAYPWIAAATVITVLAMVVTGFIRIVLTPQACTELRVCYNHDRTCEHLEIACAEASR